MNEEQMKAVQACEDALVAFKAAWGTLRDALGGEESPEGEGEMEDTGEKKVEEKESAYAAMQGRIAQLEADKVLSLFRENGYPKDMLPKFQKSITAIGLDETLQLFNSFNISKPPTGGQLPAGTLEDGLNDGERADKNRFEYFKSMSMAISPELQALATAKGWK